MVSSKSGKILIITFGFLLVLITLSLIILKPWASSETPTFSSLEVNGKTLQIETVTTPWQHYLGLSNRESLCADCGMLFIFASQEPRQFVMRNMHFPLDIIFIKDDTIVKIAKNLEPEGSEPQNLYSSDSPVDKVLEVNGGYSDTYNLRVGQKIILPNN